MVRYKEVSCKGTKRTYSYICPNYADLLDKSGCSYKYLSAEKLKEVLSQLVAQEAALAVDAAALLNKKKKTDGFSDQPGTYPRQIEARQLAQAP